MIAMMLMFGADLPAGVNDLSIFGKLSFMVSPSACNSKETVKL